ncbi:hypothetical protein BV25DRAFT_1829363 [Artomyces pyxidatus]|uniref:Uncharacterized protein n=1 Tax=Artomyces pyxidatus TaxID=48021 RepID=A0ACB8SSH6_9AGAM|nr:hypothetical protein BV25DRAFT_1829363 [Artomyces pyxidatus]
MAEVTLPLLYSNVHIFTAESLDMFVSHLYNSDQRWDSIRRIPYSTPGRWIQILDFSGLTFGAESLLAVDSLLTRIFPLVPFLAHLVLVPNMLLSNRALDALRTKEGIDHLRSLRGLKRPLPKDPSAVFNDPLIALLQCCTQLEQLEVLNPDPIPSDHLFDLPDDEDAVSAPSLRLPHLKFVALLAVASSPVFAALLRTPLPALRHLMVTPYDDSPQSPCAALLAAHGATLATLHVNTPKRWPTGAQPPRLALPPHVRHLALDYPLPALSLADTGHPLQVLTLPRPNARFLRELEALLPRLPQLALVRARNVRWLRRGVSGKALEAGVQGEMREWRRRLGRRGVRLVDGDWADPE